MAKNHSKMELIARYLDTPDGLAANTRQAKRASP